MLTVYFFQQEVFMSKHLLMTMAGCIQDHLCSPLFPEKPDWQCVATGTVTGT